MPFVVVSGLSGSGKSTVLRALEDAGFFTTDNLPPELWGTLHDLARARGLSRIAVTTDARTREFLSALEDSHARLARREENLRLLYLEADAEVLIRRFNFTRREHPLGDTLLVDFARERDLLAPMRALADTVIDTTALSAKDLTERVLSLLKLDHDFRLRLMSFGFKHSPPRDVDLVLDVRTLPNPYYDLDLRPKTGLDPAVAAYAFQGEDSESFYRDLRDFVRKAAERARASGRHGYTVGIGCTGGQHRSVAVAARLVQDLADLNPLVTDHRDMREDHG